MRMKAGNLASAVALGLGLASAGIAGSASAAEGVLSRLQGAWLSEDSTCSSVFTASGKGMTFKPQADAFVPAFIISGNRLRTALAACQVRQASESEGRITLRLSCTNSVSTAPVSGMLALGDDGKLLRFNAQGERMGSAYARCDR